MSSLTHPKTGESLPWDQLLKSGCRIFVGSHAAVPNALMADLIANSRGLHDVEVAQVFTLSDNFWAERKYSELFTVNALYIGGETIRQAVAEGRADYTPTFLSEVPKLFSDHILPLDAALIMVGPPDELGYCSLGVSVDVVSSAVKNAKTVIAQINPQMPRTNGHSFIHRDQIHAWMTAEAPIPESPPPEMDQAVEQIGQYVSLLVENGATLQIGIGRIHDAVLRYLGNHKDLGVHSEMISDGIARLMKDGVINNRKKTFHKGKTITTFCMGTRMLYDFIDGNPHVEFYPAEHVSSPVKIARNEKMVSINSAIEVDLTGQVVSDSIGCHFYSGIGGQVDFIRGAALSKGGKPIIALPSTTRDKSGKKISRIVAALTPGSGVVTSRGHVHYVVTEYGIASLRGKSVRERALELIRIAHPDFRRELLEEVRRYYWVPEYQQQAPTSVPELGPVEQKRYVFGGITYTLRPLRPSDERRLQEFFYTHNKETLLMRYNHQVTQMSRETSCSLVSVDQRKDLALCFTDRDGQREVIQGVGRYYYYEASNSCEVAFVIKESRRGKGIASTLLKEMEAVARSRGIATMFACVRRDNKPMLAIFDHNGFVTRPGDSMDELYLELDLTSAADQE
ncbi:bifunctional acetyl-CoA hydrolase/transferase family protein/GNAT family N-acetyltransferase [uncultured Microbulbifer sp.]|uniref:bifunctional acetyl-CoA hydrolase/transferase family protein/GNAT family N-acetyltransferase n=1 Tax=uncultured Microbulbifer sp. TaxID=348147 RepID=UPI0025DCB88C|nr:bifunctional acetyl-CoA hydrolase/transferase family protein/GNAT family N-acetyltransferase [uncultured Microbulbifer sp.]